MAGKKKALDTKERRKPVRAVAAKKEEEAQDLRPFLLALARACKVCVPGSVLTGFSHIVFKNSRLQARDGVIEMQAASIFPPGSEFALSHAKLASALALIDPPDKISETPEQLKLTRGPLSVRVRKLAPDLGFFDQFKMTREAKPATGLLDALKRVAPFMSEDATRPWSVSVLIANGYAWATNNLALVRVPLAPIYPEPFSIPMPAVKQLCTLDTIDYIERPAENRLIVASGKVLYRFSCGSAEWPDLAPFFKAIPKKMPPLPPEMREAAESAKRLSDRFVSIGMNKVEATSEALESTYEVDLKEGQGVFSAHILALIASVATHAEFSFYPKPIFFRGENGLEGTAVGSRTAKEEK